MTVLSKCSTKAKAETLRSGCWMGRKRRAGSLACMHRPLRRHALQRSTSSPHPRFWTPSSMRKVSQFYERRISKSSQLLAKTITARFGRSATAELQSVYLVRIVCTSILFFPNSFVQMKTAKKKNHVLSVRRLESDASQVGNEHEPTCHLHHSSHYPATPTCLDEPKLDEVFWLMEHWC